MAPRTKPCPECGDPIASYRKSCECGWSEASGVSPPKQRHMCDCAKCGTHLWYPRLKETKPKENHIIGRSIAGGYLCKNCYEVGETYASNFPREEWLERHKNDMWGAMYQAAHGVESRQDVSDLIGFLKKNVAAIGALPYNPEQVKPEPYDV